MSKIVLVKVKIVANQILVILQVKKSNFLTYFFDITVHKL